MTDAPLTTAAIGRSDAPNLRIVRDRSLYERRFKRPFDVIVSLLLAVVILPLIALIALLIRLRLGRGVFYCQERVGRDLDVFTIWKFRTMRPDRRREQASIETDRRTTHKANHDPRHTRLGRLLRKLSLDELPQLWNVLRGDMSLVGPRPELHAVAEARGYLHHVRHEVRPGMTGPYQTSNLRLGGDLRDGLDADADYVRSITLRRDISYLLKTATTVLAGSGRGA